MSKSFSKNITLTLFTRVVNLFFALLTSIIIARLLGPNGMGIYSLSLLLPAIILIFADMGISPATIYYVAKKKFPLSQILGNNFIYALIMGFLGVVVGLIIIFFFQNFIIPGVSKIYLIISLILIPLQLLFFYLQNMLSGKQNFKKYNIISFLNYFLILASVSACAFISRFGIIQVIVSIIFAWFLSDLIIFYLLKKEAGSIDFKLNREYINKSLKYGILANFANILGFLNYRLDMFLVNLFLGSTAVGFYTIGVGLAERIWIFSSVASIVLFPKVASEKNISGAKIFTPVVLRTILIVTIILSIFLYFLSKPLIYLFYSSKYLLSVSVLKSLLLGVVALSGAKILSNDIAGRGKPIINTYIASITIVVNLVLNIIWIPKYGIVGAAWASSVSYTVSFIIILFVYAKISQNKLIRILVINKKDLELYIGKMRDFANFIRKSKQKI